MWTMNVKLSIAALNLRHSIQSVAASNKHLEDYPVLSSIYQFWPNFQAPIKKKYSYSMMLLPSFVTIDMVCSGWCDALVSLQTYRFASSSPIPRWATCNNYMVLKANWLIYIDPVSLFVHSYMCTNCFRWHFLIKKKKRFLETNFNRKQIRKIKTTQIPRISSMSPGRRPLTSAWEVIKT